MQIAFASRSISDFDSETFFCFSSAASKVVNGSEIYFELFFQNEIALQSFMFISNNFPSIFRLKLNQNLFATLSNFQFVTLQSGREQFTIFITKRFQSFFRHKFTPPAVSSFHACDDVEAND